MSRGFDVALRLLKRRADLDKSADLLKRAANVLEATGWVQDAKDFAPVARDLATRIGEERRACLAFARKEARKARIGA